MARSAFDRGAWTAPRHNADQLVINELTVRTHVSNILGKRHLSNRTQAALYALKEGMASLDDVAADMG